MILFELSIFILVEEVGFYYSHVALHSSILYKHIHKIHHEWTAPIGLTALYAHPLEHVLSNLLPIAMGPLLIGSHLITTWTWYCIALVSTIISHSGYHLPLLPSPEFHDFHHFKFNQCFGACGLLDYIHGTDQLFRCKLCTNYVKSLHFDRKSKQYQRNILLIGLEPLTKTYPD